MTNTTTNKNERAESIYKTVREILETRKTRSAWDRGVAVYASHLLDNLHDDYIEYGIIDSDDLADVALVRDALLNGAKNWSEYSWGGCAYIYNGDIARVLCTPSELKRADNGNRRPNPREEWLDVQTRALKQASTLLLGLISEAVNG